MLTFCVDASVFPARVSYAKPPFFQLLNIDSNPGHAEEAHSYSLTSRTTVCGLLLLLLVAVEKLRRPVLWEASIHHCNTRLISSILLVLPRPPSLRFSL